MTSGDKALVERLRDWDSTIDPGTVTLGRKTVETAADRIEALSAEVERLREALEKIVKMYPDDGCLQWACVITARAALGETK